MKMSRIKVKIAGIIVFLLPFIVSAQSFLLQEPATDKPRISFRFSHLFFERGHLSFPSGVYDLSVSVPVNRKLSFICAAPFSVVTDTNWDESENSFGNISVGLQYRLKSKQGEVTGITGGVIIPTASSDKEGSLLIGMFTNMLEFPKFSPRVLTIYGNFAHHFIKPTGWIFDVEIGPRILIPTEDDEFNDTQVFINYGLAGGYRLKKIDLKAELAGMVIVTGHAVDIGDRFYHIAALGAQWNQGRIRPGVYYALYLKKEMSDFISGVIGIKLEIDLK
jgi:hypothetical protein